MRVQLESVDLEVFEDEGQEESDEDVLPGDKKRDVEDGESQGRGRVARPHVRGQVFHVPRFPQDTFSIFIARGIHSNIHEPRPAVACHDLK